jgi:hypothetical protein
MRWQDVEDQVRRIAELHWNAPCRAEDIDGVRFDAIIKVSPDEMVAIEITKEKDLGKLRGDVNKLSGLRFSNFQRQISQGVILLQRAKLPHSNNLAPPRM